MLGCVPNWRFRLSSHQVWKLVAKVAEFLHAYVVFGLMKELRNDQLVARITQEGSPFMVNVDILRDDSTGEFLSSASAKKEGCKSVWLEKEAYYSI